MTALRISLNTWNCASESMWNCPLVLAASVECRAFADCGTLPPARPMHDLMRSSWIDSA
jgi:hypothetical protein